MSDYAEQLRMADMRVTRPRVAVLEAVHAHPHADTDTIFGAVRAGLPEVSRQAVYDVLHALTGAGLVRRIQPSGSVARYESRVGDNHHHVVCRTCGVIADVDCAVGDAPCLTPSDDDANVDGFVLDEAEVIYWGLCPDCLRPDLAITTVITAFSPTSTSGRNQRGSGNPTHRSRADGARGKRLPDAHQATRRGRQ